MKYMKVGILRQASSPAEATGIVVVIEVQSGLVTCVTRYHYFAAIMKPLPVVCHSLWHGITLALFPILIRKHVQKVEGLSPVRVLLCCRTKYAGH